MSFCEKCGAKLNTDSSFCHRCGARVGEGKASSSKGSRRQVFEGDIHKCPNCGNPIGAFVERCSYCGFEFRNTSSSDAMKEFQEKFLKTSELSEKVYLVRSFAIPNTREDILEFIILAASSVDFNSYFDTTNQTGIRPGELSDAWMAKLSQAVNKAKIVIPEEDPYRARIAEILETLEEQIDACDKRVSRKQKSEEKQLKMLLKQEEREKTREDREFWKALGLLFLLSFIFLGIALALVYIPDYLDNKKLNKRIEEVEDLIDQDKYEAALKKASKIVYDGSDKKTAKKWNKAREDLIQRIGEAEARSLGKARIPTTKFVGGQYDDAVTAFKTAGFTNVKAVKKADLITGWINKEGEVIEVLIDGNKKYSGGDYVDSDVEVVIRYHAFK